MDVGAPLPACPSDAPFGRVPSFSFPQGGKGGMPALLRPFQPENGLHKGLRWEREQELAAPAGVAV